MINLFLNLKIWNSGNSPRHPNSMQRCHIRSENRTSTWVSIRAGSRSPNKKNNIFRITSPTRFNHLPTYRGTRRHQRNNKVHLLRGVSNYWIWKMRIYHPTSWICWVMLRGYLQPFMRVISNLKRSHSTSHCYRWVYLRRMGLLWW